MNYTDPITGWTATYLCKVCSEPYPTQVKTYPRLACPHCGQRNFKKASKKANQ